MLDSKYRELCQPGTLVIRLWYCKIYLCVSPFCRGTIEQACPIQGIRFAREEVLFYPQAVIGYGSGPQNVVHVNLSLRIFAPTVNELAKSLEDK